jgi:hypothetical protein
MGIGVVLLLGWIIYLMVLVPGFRYTVLGIILALIIIVAVSVCCRQRKQRNRYPSSLLPTSALQAGDASDIHNAPNSNTPNLNAPNSSAPNSDTPYFTQDPGRGVSEVLQLPPPAVTRHNRGSDVVPLVTHSASSTLLPMYMDGKDG